MKGLPYPLVEIALAVDDCEESCRRLAADGIKPSFTSPLPGPDTQEHLYAHGFGGLPVMVCTDGDNESMMAPFKDLEEASPPKLGVVTMGVDSIDAIAPLFRSEEHTSELQSLMRISYADFCLKKKIQRQKHATRTIHSTEACD